MKINRRILSIALSGAIAPWGLASVQAGDTGFDTASRPLSSVGRIGDTPRTIGDEESSTDGFQIGEDARPSAFRQNVVDDTVQNTYVADEANPYSFASQITDPSVLDYSGTSATTVSHHRNYASSTASYGSSRHGSNRSCGRSGFFSKVDWLEVDSLLWFGATKYTPPLVLGGPPGSLPPTQLLAGGNGGYGDELMPGLRANVGMWLDDCQTVGVGGRVFGLFTDGNSQTFDSSQYSSLGIPYFNTSLNQQDVFLVAFDTGVNGADTGSITIQDKISFIAAEGYSKFLLARSGTSRVDLVGGYTFVRLDDRLNINSRSVDGISGGVPNGTVETFNDSFSTQNTFHGGHIGFSTDIKRGRWGLSTLSKVALGNMNSSARVLGSGINSLNNQGLLARNVGTQQRDEFTFIPEAGAKLRYQITPRAQINIGYTFLFFPDVALSGGLIDPNIDVAPLGAPVAPNALFPHDSYYLHGLDLGMIFTF